MKNIRKNLLKAAVSLLVFTVFFILLSPFYVYRSVLLKLRYSSPVRTEVSIVNVIRPTEVFSGNFYPHENFVLNASKSPRTVLLELPTENRIGGFQLRFPVLMRSFRIEEAALVNQHQEYPVDLRKCEINGRNQDRMIKTSSSLTIRPGKDLCIYFFYRDYMRVHRCLDPVMAFYMALFSLLPALLVFRKFEMDFSLRDLGNIVYVSAALLLLVSPALLMDYFGSVSSEKRYLKKFPELLTHRRFNTAFPRQFEGWLEDRFSGRETAIRNEREIFAPSFRRMGRGDSGKGLIGKDGWMFTKSWNSVKMYRNENRFTEEQLKICAENANRLHQCCQELHAKLYVMLVPDKERVYPECYPDGYPQVHPESRLEQLYRYLSVHTRIPVIFPLPELRKAKKQFPVFFKTGSHWNSRGAHAAFDLLLQELQKDFPDVPADQPNAVEWHQTLSADVDIAHQVGYSDPQKQLPRELLIHEVPQIRCRYSVRDLNTLDISGIHLMEYTASVPRKKALKFFVCTDSFWDNMIPFLFPVARQMLHAYFGNGYSFELHLYSSLIRKFKPDVIVIETTERFLDRFLTITMEGDQT